MEVFGKIGEEIERVLGELGEVGENQLIGECLRSEQELVGRLWATEVIEKEGGWFVFERVLKKGDKVKIELLNIGSETDLNELAKSRCAEKSLKIEVEPVKEGGTGWIAESSMLRGGKIESLVEFERQGRIKKVGFEVGGGLGFDTGSRREALGKYSKLLRRVLREW